MHTDWLFRRIDSIQLILFRIFFGVLITLECWGALLTGWVTDTFVNTRFTFTFIGFEWTQFLLGNTMYALFFLLGLTGIGIAMGYYYRINTLLFSLGWSLAYFMQKSHYNNHYYLLMLISWFMVFMPANRSLSMDVKHRRANESSHMLSWHRYLFIAQLFIVYTFAAISKLYPGWYTGQYLHLRLSISAAWFQEHLSWHRFSSLLETENFAFAISWLGIAFDFLVIPFLLWKPTRNITFVVTLLFHLFNSITLHIGIFPYFALALSIFCFPPHFIRRLFLPTSSYDTPENVIKTTHRQKKHITTMLCFYLLWQTYLPLRHWLIPGDVLWTEEGHRLSWRMMLRSKSGNIFFYVVNKSTGTKEVVSLNNYLTAHQRQSVSVLPDVIWQFAQKLKEEYRQQGQDIAVYVHSTISINGSLYYPFIDPEIDLASVKWKYFSHQPWILDRPVDLYKKRNNMY